MKKKNGANCFLLAPFGFCELDETILKHLLVDIDNILKVLNENLTCKN